MRRLAKSVSRRSLFRSDRSLRRRLRCQRLEERHLLAAEGDLFQISGEYDAAGLVGDISAEVRWGDGTSSLADSVEGGETDSQLRIRFDYSLDTSNFFSGAGYPRRELLELAAESLVGRFADDLTAIVPGGDKRWQPSVYHPSLGGSNEILGTLTDVTPNMHIAANEIVIYVGARNLPGTIAGVAGNGSFFFPSVSISCSSQAECNQRIAAIEAFRKTVRTRGEAGADGPVQTDVGPSHGSVSFDTSTNWYFGVDADGIQPGQLDFITVAVHELAHVLGFGLFRTDLTSVWENRISNGSFTGPAARAAFAGPGNVPVDGMHWSNAVENVYGQPTSMSAGSPKGIRQLFTPLDFAAMDDLGWELIDSSTNVAAGHVYPDDGQYPAELVLRGSRMGELVYELGDISINNAAPEVTATEPISVFVDQPFRITDIGQITDAGFRNQAADPATNETFEYSIDWGDGSSRDTGSATIDRVGNGSGDLTLASFDGDHTYDTTGVRTVTLLVTDDDGATDQAIFTIDVQPPPSLYLDLNRASIREDDGNQAATLTVRRSGPVRATDHVIELRSNDVSRATVPSSVVIPAGSDRASVPVRAMDDTILQGDSWVQLLAESEDVDDDTVDLLVRDHETLAAEFDAGSVSESNPNTVRLTVRRSNDNLAAPLEVQVTTDRPGQLSLDSLVTIPAGQRQVVVDVSPIDDADPEPTRELEFVFSADGYEQGSARIQLLDDEPPYFQNPRNPLDVDDNGSVTASDALNVINELARRGAGFLLDPETQSPDGVYVDTNGDYRLTAADALLVINALSRRTFGVSEPEPLGDGGLTRRSDDESIGNLF
ncbi:MAG: dockerin type I domain-containing protein [Planctomycetota bacterium]